ncbi:thioredoxin, partial [mine drainage metagenome]
DRAHLLSAHAVELFLDAEVGAFRQAAENTFGLIVRPIEAEDSATPSAQSVLLEVLLRLMPLVGAPAFQKVASDVLSRHAAALSEANLAFSSLALAADLLGDGPVELALVPGTGDDAEVMGWLAAVGETYQPTLVTKVVHPGDTSPIALGRGPVSGSITAYICRMRTCSAPIDSLYGVLGGAWLGHRTRCMR